MTEPSDDRPHPDFEVCLRRLEQMKIDRDTMLAELTCWRKTHPHLKYSVTGNCLASTADSLGNFY